MDQGDKANEKDGSQAGTCSDQEGHGHEYQSFTGGQLVKKIGQGASQHIVSRTISGLFARRVINGSENASVYNGLTDTFCLLTLFYGINADNTVCQAGRDHGTKIIVRRGEKPPVLCRAADGCRVPEKGQGGLSYFANLYYNILYVFELIVNR